MIAVSRVVVVLTLLCCAAAQADLTPPADRKPKYPPKTRRMIRTDAELAQARENIKKYPSAKAVADGIIKEADRWLAWDDAALVELITTSDVPRAFETGAAGCPKCGDSIYQGGKGHYNWIIDLKRPFKVQCPKCKTLFPSNDYEAYYKSGLKDKKGWDTEYVDDGWGYKGANGEKYWFVAYYNHWMWHLNMTSGVHSLALAYQLTGETKYAHKAAVMLHRIAQVYPGMDHEFQSRYGEMVRAQGGHYRGKVVNSIWETGLISRLADAYDSVWETIDGDAELQKETGKTGEQIRSYVEANLLEDGIDAIFDGKIRGNFGMHQRALVKLALARQTGENAKWFDDLMNASSSRAATQGLSFALYNLVYRDGLPSETSPGYNFIWVSGISTYGSQLAKGGAKVFEIPRMRRLYDGVLDQIVVRSLTPSLGDFGTAYGALSGDSPETFQTAYRAYGDERYARMLAKSGATGDGTFKTFESLLQPPVEAKTDGLAPLPSRLMDGYGMGIVNDRADENAVSLYYGLKAGHGHFDRLAIDLFANGKPMMPDLGYPDAMNDFVPGIYSWSKNTISHNTVVVDARRQLGNVPGRAEMFVDGSFARIMDVSGDGTYPQTSTYRRALTMVDAGPGQSYYLDVFTVAGGKQHDYSLHGPPGKFEMIGGTWSEPAKGTLAGESVAVGEFYDDPKLGAKDYKGGYGGYAGSGFQHFTNVRRLTDPTAPWIGQWSHEKDASAKVRIRVLAQPGQQMILANATVSPVNHPEVLHYLIDRRQGEGLSSRFVSVIEPYKGTEFIRSVQAAGFKEGSGTAVRVERADGNTDLVVYDPAGAAKTLDAGERTDARVAVVTYRPDHAVVRAWFAGGTFLEAGGRTWKSAPAPAGDVVGVNPAKSEVRVKLSSAGDVKPELLVGRIVHFRNDLRRTAHPVAAARMEGQELVLTTKDDLIVGRARVAKIDGQAVLTKTALPLAATYKGAAVTTADFSGAWTITEAVEGKIALAETGVPPVKTGDDVWVINVHNGDTLEVPAALEWKRDGGGTAGPVGAN
jgi:hypothetical protein